MGANGRAALRRPVGKGNTEEIGNGQRCSPALSLYNRPATIEGGNNGHGIGDHQAEESTKRAVRALAENFGFDISSIARAFYKQIEREGKIPPSLAEYLKPDKKPLK